MMNIEKAKVGRYENLNPQWCKITKLNRGILNTIMTILLMLVPIKVTILEW